MGAVKSRTRTTMVLGTIVLVGLSGSVKAIEFAGGTGEMRDPYQIATVAQLVSIGSDSALLSKHFALLADVDLDPNLPGGEIFHGAVIAPWDRSQSSLSVPFTGSFDGRGHAIWNLTVVSSHSCVGLFGRIESAGRVQNLRMRDVQIKRTVSPDANDAERACLGAGALVGLNSGMISRCTVSGWTIGTESLGGLVGYNYGIVRDCYSTASVVGTYSPGGLVGVNSGSLICCYSVGPVSGPNAAGLVGVEYASTRNCFWDVQTSGCRIGCTGKGLDTAEMMNAHFYSLNGWPDGESQTWVIDDGLDYPRLAWEGTSGQPIARTSIDWFEGGGTQYDPYRIETSEQMGLLGTASILWNKHFVLCADLDLTGMPLEPIGICRGTGFGGSFDGRGHVLSHLALDGDMAPGYQGLFGFVEVKGELVRLGLRQAVVSGQDHVGALVGQNEGTIDSCFVDADVTGGNSVGGMIGINTGRVLRCYSLGSTTGNTFVGGLVGYHADGLVAYCYAAGDAESDQAEGNAGALFGSLDGRSGTSLEAYNYYLHTSDSPEPWDDGLWVDRPGTALADSQMRLCSSFMGWDFYGTAADGVGDRWFMPAGGYPVLSWQTEATGLRVIPNVRHASWDRVGGLLEEAGLVLGNVNYDYDPLVAKGRAILTHPWCCAPSGHAVDMVQSLGPYSWSENPGKGTSSDPYQIRTAGQLLSTTWDTNSRHFILMNDVSLSGRVYRYEGCVLPVLRGSFDGKGHRIMDFEGVVITLFDDIYPGATLCNLTLDRVSLVHGIGGALTWWSGGSIQNCHVIGNVAGEYRLGGLMGQNTGTVRACSMQGIIKGSGLVRGLGGLLAINDGVVEECRVRSCEILASDTTSGLAGLVGTNNGTVQNCYSEVRLSSHSAAWNGGGLVGQNNGTVADCWAFSRISLASAAWKLGGLVGGNIGTVTNCYLHGDSSHYGLGTVLSDSEMCQRASFEGWDFAGDADDGTKDIWTIREGLDYPRLWWE